MLVIGHRGAKGLAPENTLHSLRAALEHQVDGIEFDVRTTKDGMVVVFHDPSLKRIVGSNLLVSNTTYEELKSMYKDLPTLTEVIHMLVPQTLCVMEVKPGSDTTVIIQALKDLGLADLPEDAFRVASFDFKTLRTIRSELPRVALVVNEHWSGVRASRRARKLGTTYITMGQRWLWSGFIKWVARNGYRLSAYPLNSPERARKWSRSGLYAAITDFPDRFKG